MKRTPKTWFLLAAGLLSAFALWTVLLCRADLQPIGPHGSPVGLATLNRWIHDRVGVRWALYTLTDWLSLLPLAVAMGFGLLGLVQWIRRRRLSRVDADLLALGGFYLLVLALFFLFEQMPVHFRPVLIEGALEPSYPSSTTLLVLCVMPTASVLLNRRLQSRRLKRALSAAVSVFSLLMVLGRFLSGVHWPGDILGGMLLSGGLVALFCGICRRLDQKP